MVIPPGSLCGGLWKALDTREQCEDSHTAANTPTALGMLGAQTWIRQQSEQTQEGNSKSLELEGKLARVQMLAQG